MKNLLVIAVVLCAVAANAGVIRTTSKLVYKGTSKVVHATAKVVKVTAKVIY